MRAATNQVGIAVEILTPYGWSVAGCGKVYPTHEAARAGMAELMARFPEREFRVYAALEAKP